MIFDVAQRGQSVMSSDILRFLVWRIFSIHYGSSMSAGFDAPAIFIEATMNEMEYQNLDKLTDHELFDFLTETDASQRKWVAIHLLEMRRNRAIASAAKSSAVAAWMAAAVAGVSAIVAILAYLQGAAR